MCLHNTANSMYKGKYRVVYSRFLSMVASRTSWI